MNKAKITNPIIKVFRKYKDYPSILLIYSKLGSPESGFFQYNK